MLKRAKSQNKPKLYKIYFLSVETLDSKQDTMTVKPKQDELKLTVKFMYRVKQK